MKVERSNSEVGAGASPTPGKLDEEHVAHLLGTAIVCVTDLKRDDLTRREGGSLGRLNMANNTEKTNPVLVTTEHRGVFFGYLIGEPSKEKVMLSDARNCVSWERSMRGVFGLAEAGPNEQCKIGPAVAELTLWDITAVATCTPEAAARWEKSPWA